MLSHLFIDRNTYLNCCQFSQPYFDFTDTIGIFSAVKQAFIYAFAFTTMGKHNGNKKKQKHFNFLFVTFLYLKIRML